MTSQGEPTDAVLALPATLVEDLRARLLEWYEEHGQDFPWRSARDPYRALVAATCAQQTQMVRVLPTYERWVEAFPTLATAAAATVEEALRVWDRAGYPRRALNLRAAARICLERHDGRLPESDAELLALPGVGPFTAAIVRCFGFGHDSVAIDTNVVRLLGRVIAGDLQPQRETAGSRIVAWAAQLVPSNEPERWNPAVMDFGGLVCAARPRCGACVLSSMCAARPRFEAGEQARPVRAQGRFEGSDRQWRGRVLASLRSEVGAVRVTSLVATLASGPEDERRVRALLRTLAAEGLVWSRGGWCGLGDGPRRAVSKGRRGG